MLARADAFLGEWAAHGAPLTCARDWRHGRFLLVAVDEASVPLGVLHRRHGGGSEGRRGRPGAFVLGPFSGLLPGRGEIRRVSRAEFKALVEAGEVDLETPVFDNSITRLEALKSGEWKKPAGASWHRRAFFSAP